MIRSSCRRRMATRRSNKVGRAVLAFSAALILLASAAYAGFNRSSSVGGVSISVDGILSSVTLEAQQELRTARERLAAAQPGALKPFSDMRMISLRRLDEAIKKHRSAEVVPLTEEITHLAGLQRIRYIFVLPEQNDIVLAGPAEGWKIDAVGNAVGLTTGQPVLLLDDLMAAMRNIRSAGQQGFSCSIDPTQQGLQNLQQHVSKLKVIGNPQQTMAGIEEALGPQKISVTGIPATSHFARVMVAADYRMKRLAMNFDEPPIDKLPSFLHLASASGRGMSNMLPRWWLAPTADPLIADPNGLAWEMRNVGVKCMTEEDFVAADGTRKQGVSAGSLIAKKWADTFTARYDELAKRDTIFGQLRNLIDLSVAAALIDRENMFERAGLEAPFLMGEEMLDGYEAPKQVASQASVLKKGRNWLISASGGVQMFPYELASRTTKGESMDSKRNLAATTGDAWWWD